MKKMEKEEILLWAEHYNSIGNEFCFMAQLLKTEKTETAGKFLEGHLLPFWKLLFEKLKKEATTDVLQEAFERVDAFLEQEARLLLGKAGRDCRQFAELPKEEPACRVISTVGRGNCGGRCIVKSHEADRRAGRREILQDQEFLDRFCIGFDEAHMPEGAEKEDCYLDYLLGKKDGVAKTPQWAFQITGVPVETIVQFARKYATVKPAALIPGLGHQRQGNGEQAVRSTTLLPCLTGNVGMYGGHAGGGAYCGNHRMPQFPVGHNPYPGSIPSFLWTAAVAWERPLTAIEDGVRGMEELQSPEKGSYPIQLIGFHNKTHCHSVHDNNPVMEIVEPHRVWIHKADAKARGIVDGDEVLIYNDRGRIRMKAYVTERILQGVAAMPQGGYRRLNARGEDIRGDINTITTLQPTPLARGNPQHSNLVEIQKAGEANETGT